MSVCATCYEPLVERGDDEFCVHCLASFLFTDEELPEDLPGDDPLRVQRWHYGHFEIKSNADGLPVELGHGSMGATYLAHDTILNRNVALKIIDRDVAEQPAVRARFLREAQAAARLQHPNVAAVSHYGEQAGECFYVMELVAGETLAERVQREGPLAAGLTLEVAIQVARALAAAEAEGIVHRDLKPSNIMLATADSESGSAVPVVKVIDFGLAKAVSASAPRGPEDTRGGFVGTPAFASPEQFARREEEHIDTRSDVYSLGVTTWYLLCGKVPFVGRTLTEIHEQQTRQPLPLAQLKTARVPDALVKLLRTLLAPTPAARPQNARELLAALERCRRALPPPPRIVRRRRMLLLAGSLALLTFAGWWVYRATRPPPPPPDRSIAVLPFENRSANPADAFFTTGVRDQIASDLAHIGGLKFIGSDGIKDDQPEKARDDGAIGRALGVRYLLTGSLERLADKFDVTVALIDTHDPARTWTRRYLRTAPEIFAVQGEITRAVADQLQAPLTAEEKITVNRPPTTNLAAYDLYLQAISPMKTFGNEPPYRAEKTRRLNLLKQAIALDPNFTLAYCQAAHDHDMISYYRTNMTPEELSVDHRGLAEACLTRAHRLQPDLGEVHFALAFHYDRVNHDIEQADREIKLAEKALPNNADVAALAGTLASRQCRWDEAVRNLERAIELNPSSPGRLQPLIFLFHALRRYDDWERLERRYDKLVSPEIGHEAFPAEDALVMFERNADLGPWRRLLEGPSQGDDDEIIRLLLFFYEGDAGSISRILAATHETEYVVNGYVNPKEWYEAMAALIGDDEAATREALTRARPKLELAMRDQPTAGIPLSLLAMADALLGRTEDAVREGRRACELTTFEAGGLEAPVVRCNLAIVYAWTGQPDLAFAGLNELVTLPVEGSYFPDQPTYGDFRFNPLWRPLRGDPRFAELEKTLARFSKK